MGGVSIPQSSQIAWWRYGSWTKVGVVTRNKEIDVVGGGRDAITMSPKMIETLVKFETDLTQIKKPSNETKFKT